MSTTPPGNPPPLTPQDPDVATGLAVRAASRTLTILAATTVVLGFIAVGAAQMAQVERGGAGADTVIPGLAVLMVGELVALIATGLAAWVLIQLLRGRVPVPAHAVAGLRRALGRLTRLLIVVVIGAVIVGVIVRADAWLSVVLGGLVALQVVVIFAVVRTQVLRVRT